MTFTEIVNKIQRKHFIAVIIFLCLIIIIQSIYHFAGSNLNQPFKTNNTPPTTVPSISNTLSPTVVVSNDNGQNLECQIREISTLAKTEMDNMYVNYLDNDSTKLYIIDQGTDTQCFAYLAFDYKTELSKLGYKVNETPQIMHPINTKNNIAYFEYHDFEYELSFWSYNLETKVFSKLQNVSDTIFGKSSTPPLYAIGETTVTSIYDQNIIIFSILAFEGGPYCMEEKDQEACLDDVEVRQKIGESKLGVWAYNIKTGKVTQVSPY